VGRAVGVSVRMKCLDVYMCWGWVVNGPDSYVSVVFDC
jgi:hypothetical protein